MNQTGSGTFHPIVKEQPPQMSPPAEAFGRIIQGSLPVPQEGVQAIKNATEIPPECQGIYAAAATSKQVTKQPANRYAALIIDGQAATNASPMTLPRRNRLLRLLTFVLALALSVISAAPLPSVPAQESGGRIRVESNLVLVEATVKDKSGRVIDGLTEKDFELREDGVPQTISHFSRDQLPLAVALVVDLSTSIQPFLRPLRYATQTALRSLKPEDEVALFTFTGRVERPVDLTRDKRAVSDQIQYFTAGGSTNINGAIYEAANYLRGQSPAARRVIILVSDNVPTDEGGVPAKQVEDAVLEADSAVYSLKIPGQNPPEARLAAKFGGKVNVSRLAADAGGEIFDVEKEGSLYLAFEALIERLKTRYTLGYAPTHAVRDGKLHALEVHLVASHGTPGKDYTVLAKRGFFASATRVSGTP